MAEILLIDDEMSAIDSFTASLFDQAEKISYKIFSNMPMEALEYAKTHLIAAAFLDINMPQINCIKLAEMLIEIAPTVKIIFITGYSYNKNEIAAKLKDNFWGFCHKPFEREELQKLMMSVIHNSNNSIEIRTIGGFDVFIKGRALSFSCKKAKELLALLVHKKAGYVSISETIALLWPDKNPELAKRLYRDVVSRLRRLLCEYKIDQYVRIERGRAALNPNDLVVDFWQLNKTEQKENADRYLSCYDWRFDV